MQSLLPPDPEHAIRSRSTPRAILAFGDSLTWGRNPLADGRHRFEDRWTTVLETGLAGAARVIAEGLSGRTTCFDDPQPAVDRNGARILPTLLASHAPLDLVIIMLGTNDLKPAICGRADGAVVGILRLVEMVRAHPYGVDVPIPGVLLVAPPPFGKTSKPDGQPARGRSIDESRAFASLLRAAAGEHGCAFFDAASVARSCTQDGVHLDAENTVAIGRALVPIVHELIA